MKNFYIIANYEKEYVKEAEAAIRDYLTQRGAVCNGAGEQALGKVSSADVPEETECIITIGGDGTLIQAARNLAGRQIPMVGVNRGHLGFLNQVSRKEDVGPVMDALLADRFQLEERMMLSGTVVRDGKEVFSNIALNEIAVTRKDVLKSLRFCVYINKEFLNHYSADGILAATPTGSTAYNLSAGGPVVDPAARMIVLTPICPHALNARSVVLGAEDEVEIHFESRGQVVSFDGDTFFLAEPGDKVVIQRSPVQTVMVRFKHISFMQSLSNHLAGII